MKFLNILTKEVLIEDYINKQFTATEITKKYGMKSCTIIKKYLEFYNISIRLRPQRKQHFCIICEAKITRHNKNGLCKKCAGLKRRKVLQKYCKGCSKELDKYGSSIMCRKCENKYRRIHPIKYCKDCGKLLVLSSAIRCKKCSKKGVLSVNYKNGGISSLASNIRHSPEYKEWRNYIFIKYKYICQDCGQVGGKLEVHHCKIEFKNMLENFLLLYPNLSPTKDKDKLLILSQKYQNFWDTNNGITLCKNYHRQLHKREGI